MGLKGVVWKLSVSKSHNYPLSMDARLNQELLIQLRLDRLKKISTLLNVSNTHLYMSPGQLDWDSRPTMSRLLAVSLWVTIRHGHWPVFNGLATYDHVLQKDSRWRRINGTMLARSCVNLWLSGGRSRRNGSLPGPICGGQRTIAICSPQWQYDHVLQTYSVCLWTREEKIRF